MKKTIILIFFYLFVFQSFSQDIFELVKGNEFKLVKKYKGDLNVEDENMATPLMWAVYQSDLKMVKKMISNGAEVNRKGWLKFIDTLQMSEFMYGSCLVIAAGENKMDILEFLVKKLEVPVDDREINLYNGTDDGWTALHWAAAKGNCDIIKYLIKNGASIDAEAETDHNQTPLHFALRYKQDEAAKVLIDSGADINKQDLYENSPLLYALHYKNKPIVKYLIEKGARPGIQGLNVNGLLKEYFGVENYGEL